MIPAHGTLGLLVRAVRQQLRPAQDVVALLEAVPARSTLHIRPSLLQAIIQDARVEWGLHQRAP